MNAQSATPLDPSSADQTRASVTASVNAGIEEAAKHESALAESAESRAAEIISRIPNLVQKATKESVRTNSRSSYSRAELMPIGVEDISEYLITGATSVLQSTYPNPKNLKHAALLVFDHCVAAGLHTYIDRSLAEGEKYVTYSLCITWPMPQKEQPKSQILRTGFLGILDNIASRWVSW